MTYSKLLYWPYLVLSILVALASWRFFAFGVEASMNAMLYHAQQRPVWFYTHVSLAPVALFLMPFQHLPKMRLNHIRLHRTLGRLYVVSVTLSGLGGIGLAGTTNAGNVAALGFGLLGVAWVGTTIMAVKLAIQKRISEHRVWMIRSSALTFAAVTLRLYIPLFMAAGAPFEPAYVAISWLCWVPNLLIVEFYLRRKQQSNPVAV